MRVLVTGGTGFVGSHSVRALRAAGHTLRLLARSREKVERVFAGRGARPTLVIGDVTDPTAVAKALDGVDAVVHCAAVVAIEARRAREVHDTNLRAVELVVGGAAERGVGSIVYVSSLGALFAPGAPLGERSPIAAAHSPYARSKADGEALRAQAPGRGRADPHRVSARHHRPRRSRASPRATTRSRAFLRQLMVDTASGFQMVDVRDLAALIAALVAPSAAPGRYVVSGSYLPVAGRDRADGRAHRTPRAPRPRSTAALLRALGRVGDLVKHVYPFDFPLSGEAMDFATQWPGVVRSPAIDALGIRFRDGRETYADTIRWLYRAGHLTAREAGRLAQ